MTAVTTVVYTTAVTQQMIPVLAAIVAQFLFTLAFYNHLAGSAWGAAFARDKGVKKPEFAKARYPTFICAASTLWCSLARAMTIHSLVTVLGVQGSYCMTLQTALAVQVFGLAAMHSKLWAQRPMVMIVLEQVAELGCAVIAASVLFFLSRA